MARIEFTDNYQDLSTNNGYQFKFFCQCCGNGYMSSWKANTLGVAGGLLRGAGSLFGGVFGRAGSSAYEVQRAVGVDLGSHLAFWQIWLAPLLASRRMGSPSPALMGHPHASTTTGGAAWR